MDSRILFLGSAGDSFTVSRQSLGSGGFIIQSEGYQFHVDPGPGTLNQMNNFQVNPRETTTLFITNRSYIHSNDINAVISAMTLGGADQNGVVIANPEVVNGSEKEIPALYNACKNFPERIISPMPGQRIGIENIEIHTLKTKNDNPFVFGLKFITPKFVLSYSGDTRYSKEIVEQYSDSDVLILNVTHPFNEKSNCCFNADDVVKIIQEARPNLTILTHFGKKLQESNPMYVARDIHSRTSSEVICARAGLSVNPVSFSSTVMQSKLNQFG